MAAPVPGHLKGLSRDQRRAYYRRTTPASRARLLSQLQAASGQPPPPGTYHEGDYFLPEIDQSRRAVRRGAEDALGLGGLEASPGTPFGGSLGTQLRRSTEDYELARQDNTRQYDELGNVQQSRAVSQGVDEGGTLLAALQARQANMGRDQGRLGVNYTRGAEDINTEAERVRREGNVALGDLLQTETFAAGQAGFVPPPDAAPGTAGTPTGNLSRFKSGPSPGTGYYWNGTRWVNRGPSPGPGYQWNGTAWIRTGPSPGKGYKWNGTRWVKG